jgi:AmmeMemoRadiSam system protein B/AmmeMemoRadiSam system protein A
MTRSGRLFIVAALLVGLGGCDRRPGQSQGSLPQAPAERQVREAAVAGIFYPGRKEDLAKAVDQYLSDVKPVPIGNLRGLICPHAGYEFSGPVAAIAYKQLAGRDVDTVIVMAPSHYADFEGASIPDAGAYQTPLGAVALSPRTEKLVKTPPFVRNPPCQVARPGWWRQAPKELPPFGEDTPHTWEHSLEVQLPFLQRTLKEFTIVPIVFGRADPEKAADALAPFLDEKTILVASSDLSHFYPYDAALQLDASCIRAICDLDVEWMEGEEACGKLPILTLMHLAKKNKWQAKLLDYRNSGDTSGDKSRVVGYAAIAFFQPEKGKPPAEAPTSQLTPEEGEVLLELAAKTVQQVVQHGTQPSVDLADLPESLREPRACFVTLNKEGQLRGCIGSIFPREPLGRAVVGRARSAATEDSRFPRVKPEELEQLEIEVSVLTVPGRLEFESPDDLLRKLRPEVDGVVLRLGRRQATYLPQVWEKIPDAETFLTHLSEKAGLWPDAWKSPNAMILVYQVQAFQQSEM